MTIGERIKYLRKDLLKLTLERFGERIGLKKSALSRIENGTIIPTEQTILSICREFNISETWLRTGEGEISHPLTREAEIAEILQYNATEADLKFIRAYLELDPSVRQLLHNHFKTT